MAETQTQTPTAPVAAPPKPVKSFKDPDFIAKIDAGYKNSEAIAAGLPPTTSTDEPSPDGQPTNPPASSGATPPTAGTNTTSPAASPAADAAGSESHTATKPADPPYDKKKAADWEAMRTRHQEETQRLRAELEAAKKGADTTTLDELRNQLDEYQRELRMVAVERDPVFRNEWASKQKGAIERLKAAAGKNGDQLAAVAQLPPNEQRDRLISELLGDLPSWKAAEVGTAMAEIGRLEYERQALVERTKANLDAQARQMDAERQAQQRAITATFDKTVNEWHDALSDLAAGDAQKVESAVALARNAFNGSLSPKDLAKFAMWGGVGPLAVNDAIAKGQALVAKDAEIAALKAQLAKLSGVQPLAGGQAPSAAPTNNDDTKPAGMSFGEWTALQAQRAGMLQR